MSESHADRPSLPSPPGDPKCLQPDRGRQPVGRRLYQLPRYKVILHQNPAIDLMVVVRSVMELMRFPRAEATHKMWEAHHNGRSVILITWLERAELYVEQFANKGLLTSVEPV
jgi:ATP-dependent Clp protease adapter protein ClpS